MDNKTGVFAIECLNRKMVFVSCSKNVGSRLRGYKKKLRENAYEGIDGNLGSLQKDFIEYGEEGFSYEWRECSEMELLLEQGRMIKDYAERGFTFYNHIYHAPVMEIPEDREKIVKKLLLMVDTYGEEDVSDCLDRLMEHFGTRPGGSRG